MKDILLSFQNAIDKNRLSHLYLVSGAKGKVKKQLALEIAYLILKKDKDYPELKNQILNENHPNLIYLSKDGLSVKKEQVLNLQKEFSKTSLVTGKRIFIIDDAETMSISAANSLLKFLEEPKGEETIGILLTEDQNQIIPTILSRSQIILYLEQQEDTFINQLLENQIDNEQAFYLSVLTKDIDTALTALDDPNFELSIKLFKQLINYFENPKLPLSLIFMSIEQAFINQKEWITYIFDLTTLYLLDIVHLHMNQKIFFDFMKNEIIQTTTKYDVELSTKIINLIHETIINLRMPINISLRLQALSINIEKQVKHVNNS